MKSYTPDNTMPLFKAKLDVVIEAINNKNEDWVHLCIGREGVGKSSLAIQLCMYVDPTFDESRIIFNVQQFENAIVNAKRGQAVLIDEGALIAFSRDAMAKDVKYVIRTLSACRKLGLFICLCIPKLMLLDRYIREERAASLTRVVMRGRYFVYNKHRMVRLVRYMKNPYKKKKPKPMLKESYIACDKIYPELWNRYILKNENEFKRPENLQNNGKTFENLRLSSPREVVKEDKISPAELRRLTKELERGVDYIKTRGNHARYFEKGREKLRNLYYNHEIPSVLSILSDKSAIPSNKL